MLNGNVDNSTSSSLCDDNVDNSTSSSQSDDDVPRIIDKSWELNQPVLEELAPAMDEFLRPFFKDFAVKIVDCPDLTLSPLSLTAPGLCGHAEVIEFGNYEHLYNPAKNKIVSWFLPRILNRYTERTNSFVIGGTMYRGRHSTVPNKEIVMNLTYSSDSGFHKMENNYIFLNEEGQVGTECVLNSVPPHCDLYGSFYVCRGKQEKVLEVYAKEARNSDLQIFNLMRHALSCRYVNANIGLSGLLFISEGEVEATVMPRTFSQTLLQDAEEIYEWNHKCNITAPVVVRNTMFNFNTLNIKFDRQLCRNKVCTVNSNSGEIIWDAGKQFVGSRFHRFITPEKMECRGYFNVVSKLHRVGAEVIY